MQGRNSMLRLRFATLLLFFIGLLSGAYASAQSVDPAYLKIKKARDIAMQNGDDKVYGRYTTDNFWVVMPDGSVQTKQDRIKSLIAMKKAASASQAQSQQKPPR